MSDRTIQVDQKLPLLETIPLSLQHLFAMFGSTVLVPILFKVNPATILLFNGIGTLFVSNKLDAVVPINTTLSLKLVLLI